MSGRRRRAMLGALIATSLAVTGVSAAAAGQGAGPCMAEADFTMSPGLSTSGTSGTFTTGGDTGTFDCRDGQKGTMGFSGRYGTKDPDSCSTGGEGVSTNSFKFSDNSGDVGEQVDFTYGPFQGGALGGSFKGARTSGTFEVTGIEGDCVSKPITKAHAVFKNVVIKR